MDRIKLSNTLAIIATILGFSGLVIGFGFGVATLGEILLVAGVSTSLVSYVLCGFFKAIGAAWNIAKWGLVSCPFPYNFVITPVVACLAIGALLICPIAITRKA